MKNGKIIDFVFNIFAKKIIEFRLIFQSKGVEFVYLHHIFLLLWGRLYDCCKQSSRTRDIFFNVNVATENELVLYKNIHQNKIRRVCHTWQLYT